VNNLVEQLATTVKNKPDAVAVVHAERQCTYQQLWYTICRVSQFLSELIQVGDRVALLLENSIEYIEACYAVWKAGGVVVGLNTALKSSELCRLIEHCQAKIVFSDKPREELFNSVGEQVIAVPVKTAEIFNQSKSDWPMDRNAVADRLPSISDDALAMIIYTSGTTGHPKGVMLSHRNLCTNMRSIIQYLKITGCDIAMCVLPFFYSYGNSVLHTHLVKGSMLVLENSFAFPGKVLESMQKFRVTAFYGVPSTYYLLLARTSVEKYNLTSLRYCAQAGGPMDFAKIQVFRSSVPGADFIVMYGQTEATARLTYLEPADLDGHPGSVGKPVAGVEIKILDRHGRIRSSGETGEVCVRGENVMCGYLNDKTETEKVLKEHWLYTGDTGYLDDNGFLYLQGRNSEMIKTGAYRVSPREIEELIATHPAVAEVAVVAANDDLLGSVVRACVVCHPDFIGNKVLKQEILRLCKEELPLYKIPRYLDFLSDLPKTASGKIKKYALVNPIRTEN